MGVTSFALIVMAGLTMTGFKGSQQAFNTTTETEIAQQVVNQLELTSYANIIASGSTNYYFTQEGLPTNAASSIYSASVTAPSSVALPNTGTSVASQNVVLITVNITSTSTPAATNAIQVYIPNAGF